MSNSKKSTYVVTHPSFYISVGGKLQEQVVGSELTLKKEIGDRYVAKKFVVEKQKPQKLSTS